MLSKRQLKRLVKREKERLTSVLSADKKCNSGTTDVVLQNEAYEHAEDESPDTEDQSHMSEALPKKNNLKEQIKSWYYKHLPSVQCSKDLLEILISQNMCVPKSVNGLIGRNKNICIRTVSPGQYVHIGIENQLLKIAEELGEERQIILDIGIDGLPLYKSSSVGLWPILGRAVNIPSKCVFMIGSYIGIKKPIFVESYLHDFVSEVKNLIDNGIRSEEKVFTICIRAFICDAPARSFICGIKGHTSLSGCNKCQQNGLRINNVTTYSSTAGIIRSDSSYTNRLDKNFHRPSYIEMKHCLEEIGIQMISQFPLDVMHLIDLGVMKKMLVLLLNGGSCVKLKPKKKVEMSSKLTSFILYIPRDFARKPRSFEEILRWKATEFRQFILYTGLVICKEFMPEDMFYHFLLLHCAYRMLLCPKNFRSNVSNADEMLKDFVEHFSKFYGPTSVSYNVHNLLHLTDCVDKCGCLDTFTAYDFENFNKTIKKNIKKPNQIPQQIYNKFYHAPIAIKKPTHGIKQNSHGRVMSYSSNSYYSPHFPDNYCAMEPFEPVIILEIYDNGLFKGKRVLNGSNFFTEPVRSLELGITLVNLKILGPEEIFELKKIFTKLFYIPYENDALLIPLLHECI